MSPTSVLRIIPYNNTEREKVTTYSLLPHDCKVMSNPQNVHNFPETLSVIKIVFGEKKAFLSPFSDREIFHSCFLQFYFWKFNLLLQNMSCKNAKLYLKSNPFFSFLFGATKKISNFIFATTQNSIQNTKKMGLFFGTTLAVLLDKYCSSLY